MWCGWNNYRWIYILSWIEDSPSYHFAKQTSVFELPHGCLQSIHWDDIAVSHVRNAPISVPCGTERVEGLAERVDTRATVKPPVKDMEALCYRPFVIILLNVVYSVSKMRKRTKENFTSANMNHMLSCSDTKKKQISISCFTILTQKSFHLVKGCMIDWMTDYCMYTAKTLCKFNPQITQIKLNQTDHYSFMGFGRLLLCYLLFVVISFPSW